MLAIVFSIVCALFFQSVAFNVDYQIHSNNDLREMRQDLIKGARRFKFDPHYVSNHYNCAGKKDCLLLNHDRPTTTFSSYNTSSDLLHYLAGDEFRRITGNEPVTVALCFKSAPDMCKNTTDFNSWLSLVDEFHAEALKILPKNVEIILDGGAKPKNCLIGRWFPWNSVWIVTDSPADAFYSNAESKDYYRYQVLNNPENTTNWKWMAESAVNYGKFSNSSYPYQLWEPDRQEDIAEYVAIYQSGAPHAAEYHFAINSDIAMFRVFSTGGGSDMGVAINQLLSSSTKGKAPLLVQLNTEWYFSSALYDTAHKYSMVHVDTAKSIATSTTPVAFPADIHGWLGGKTVVNAVLESANIITSQYTLLLTASSGHFLRFTVHIANDNTVSILPAISTGVVAAAHGKVMDVAVSAWQCSVEGASCLLLLWHDESLDRLLIESIVLASSSATATAPNVDTATLTVTSQALITLSSSISHVDAAQLVSFQDTAQRMVAMYSNDDKIRGTTFTLPATSATVDAAWVLLTVGRHFDLSLTGDGVMLLLNDYGYCYNSHDHNTRSYPTVCAATPKASEHVLDYSLGLLQDWLNTLSAKSATALSGGSAVDGDSSSSNARGDDHYALSSCHHDILHGTYDQGSKPVLALSSSPTSGAFFLSLHEGLSESTSSSGSASRNSKHSSDYVNGDSAWPWDSSNGCGEPIARDGIVVDSFLINEWVQTLRRKVELNL